MDDLTPSHAALSALAMAVCDLLAVERAKLNALLQLLERKELVSADELNAAGQSISALPASELGEDVQRLHTLIRERMMVRLQELALHSGPVGKKQ